MKRVFIYAVGSMIAMFLYTCSSKDDDCMKTINIPQFYIVNNQTFNHSTTQEVPCDFPDPVDAELVEPPELENFTYEVLSFVYTPDTGNNTSRLQFEIKLNNPNNFTATGVPILTINYDQIQFTGSLSNNATIPCYEIEANSHCILTFDQEDSLDFGSNDSVVLGNVRYYLTE